jgi:N-acetylglucosaminyldiphosphoundecaprenol N-acetyl-beta-D-mannosaminyltransferase
MSSASLQRRADYQVRGPFRRERRPEQRITLLGATMDLVKPEEMLDFVRRSAAAGRKAVVANHNLHSLHLLPRHPEMAALYARADIVEVDSTPLTLWARLIYGRSRRFHRCTYMDFRSLFWDLAVEHGWRVYYLGGAPGVVEQAAATIRARWPGAAIGGRDGFFAWGGMAEDAVLADIARFRPSVLMVGMGMPRQEAWIARTFDRLPDCVILPVGAAFDYEAGAVVTPPSWTGRMGLEGVYRLLCEPRRMFARYLVEPWSLVGPALADLARRSDLRRRHAPAPYARLPGPGAPV